MDTVPTTISISYLAKQNIENEKGLADSKGDKNKDQKNKKTDGAAVQRGKVSLNQKSRNE